jgi:hypothetical protein
MIIPPSPLAAQSPSSPPIAEQDDYLSKAGEALDSNHLSEAIRSLVTVLVLAADNPGEDTGARAAQAEAELGRIGARLSLEPGSEWLDAKGTQLSGSSRQLLAQSGAGGLAPSVYLYEDLGSGKSPVVDAPIYFQFIKNSGSLIPLVTTDAYGKANTTVTQLDEPESAALIRAYPVFTVRGRAYPFHSVFRDFAYLPSVVAIRLFALERSELGANDSPRSVDPAAQALGELGVQVLPSGMTLGEADFRKAQRGDAAALASLGLDVSATYAGLILVEVSPARQVELGGKKYKLFSAAASLGLRILRADGALVFALPLDGIRGQGGTGEAAVADAFRRAGEALGTELRKKAQDLKRALAGD